MRFLLLFVAIVCFPASLLAQDRERPGRGYPPEMPGAKVEAYKSADDVKAGGKTELKLYIFEPKGWMPTDGKSGQGRPAIVFFFGGGWTGGSPVQFLEQCKYLASRGMVAIAADYRVASRHGVKAVDCVRDAKSAIRYVRKNAGRLGVDPERIAAGGGSAGGHLAAACGTLEEFDEPGEDASVSSKPNALLLFNPAVVLAPVKGVTLNRQRTINMDERAGVEATRISPYHHVKAGVPPTVIFHGRADATVPYATVEVFAKAMQDAGNTCELFGYDDQGHGFFNNRRGGGKMYATTLRETDKFLAKLGWLEGEPTVAEQ
jgi:acetyl esterase/lipase